MEHWTLRLTGKTLEPLQDPTRPKFFNQRFARYFSSWHDVTGVWAALDPKKLQGHFFLCLGALAILVQLEGIFLSLFSTLHMPAVWHASH